MHAKGIIKQRLAYVSGGAAVAEEVTPKPGAKKPICEGDARGGKRAGQEKLRGGGHRGWD